MERIGTAIISTLGIMALSVFAASPEPAVVSDTPANMQSSFQDDMDQMLNVIQEAKADQSQMLDQTSGKLDMMEQQIDRISDAVNAAVNTMKDDKLPDFDDLPEFDSGGSDGATNTPGWEAGTLSQTGSGSSGGTASSSLFTPNFVTPNILPPIKISSSTLRGHTKEPRAVFSSAKCPCGPNCNCASVSMVSAPVYSGGSSGSYSNMQVGPMQILQQRIRQPERQTVRGNLLRPVIQRGVLNQPRRTLNCSDGTCTWQ